MTYTSKKSNDLMGGLLSLLHPCELKLGKGLAAPWQMERTKRHFQTHPGRKARVSHFATLIDQDFFGDQANIAGVRVKWSPENKKGGLKNGRIHGDGV